MKSKSDWRVLKRLMQLATQGNFTLAHSHLVHANVVTRTALRHAPIPVVSTCHIVERRFRPWHGWAERLTAPWANAITAVSRDVLDALRRLRIPEEKLHLVANGIDTMRFAPPAPGNLRDLDILYVGRLDRQKGIDRLLPAIKVAKSIRPLTFAAVGTGPESDRLKEQARQLGLEVDWQGFVPDTAPWYRRAKVVVMPSRWEGFGLTAAEALASGCDLWHSGTDPLPEIAGPFGNTLPENDASCGRLLAKAVADFREDDRRHAWVKAHWDKDFMIKGYLNLYQQLS